MGACCSCFDAITGGKHSSSSHDTEMISPRNSANGIPAATHSISRAMSAPTIQIQGFKVSGSGLALAKIPVEQGKQLLYNFNIVHMMYVYVLFAMA